MLKAILSTLDASLKKTNKNPVFMELYCSERKDLEKREGNIEERNRCDPKRGNLPTKKITEGKKCFGCKQFNFKKHRQAKHQND